MTSSKNEKVSILEQMPLLDSQFNTYTFSLTPVTLIVNGTEHTLQLDPRTHYTQCKPPFCTFALESAVDELGYELGIDPVELRLINHADVNPHTNKPWSSKYLRECYHLGAERFGWSRRNPQPGSMQDGGDLIGWGMATATYPGYRFPASANVQLFADGRAVISSATYDRCTKFGRLSCACSS